MARKILNRKELRKENEDAEGKEPEEKKTVKKAAPRARNRAKAAKEVRLKAFWGVFSQSLNAVVLFEHGQREQADQRAEELTASRKSPHFVQLVKKVIEE
jgi:hypothetical protein